MSDASAAESGTLSAQDGNYHSLKAWIAAQETYEAETDHPAPLTAAQRKAIAELTGITPSAVTQYVDADDKDYISILEHFLAATQAAGTTISYSDAFPTPSRLPSPLWTQSLTLTLPPSPPTTFPPSNHPSAPSFKRKKDAKRYAAKLCVEHLLLQGHLIPAPSPSHLPPLIPCASLVPRRRGLPAPATAALDPHDDRVPATQRVEQLCRKLGFQAPSYRLSQVAGSIGTWDGEADFGRDAFRVPVEGVGTVEGVFGRKQAREAVARKCLGYLVGVEEERRRLGRRVLGDG